MNKWSRSDLISFGSLVVAVIACMAALVVVPEVRSFWGLTVDPTPVESPNASSATSGKPSRTTNGESAPRTNMAGKLKSSPVKLKPRPEVPSEKAPQGGAMGTAEASAGSSVAAGQLGSPTGVSFQETSGKIHLSDLNDEVALLNYRNITKISFNKSWPASLGSKRRRPLLLYFWTNWCVPAVRDLPLISQLQQKHTNILFVGLSDSADNSSAELLTRTPNLSLQYVFSDYGLFKKMFREERNFVCPSYVLFAGDGYEDVKFIGSISLKANLDKLEAGLQSVSSAGSLSLAPP